MAYHPPLLGRRQWLTITATLLAPRVLFAQSAGSAREARIRRIIQAYSDQGYHRTGTRVDRASANWLRDQVRDFGVKASLEGFSHDRVDPVTSIVVVGGRRIEGLPLFDAAFTDRKGVTGKLGPLDSDAAIGLTDSLPNAAAAAALGGARKENRHQAIVCITRGARPGLCPSNADSFLQPFGPPVLQVSDEEAESLLQLAKRGVDATVIAHVKRSRTTAFNVTATLTGRDRSLPPLVVMTPRSGWYACASERGGGIACWIEVMRELSQQKLARDVVFVASSGHELGHLGINAFVDRRPGIVSRAAAWMHFGANIGAAAGIPAAMLRTTAPPPVPLSSSLPGTRGNTIQSSDDEMQRLLEQAMRANELFLGMRMPHDRVPGGEAEVVHRGGGRYLSVIGGNLMFHNPGDRGAAMSDANSISHWVDAFVSIARQLAMN
ncbi:MAG: hypothetical protein K2Y23_21180 [Cyanobacteria bacterium]|nr:hypothetical protein [Cyanobacteriota bacterium]